MRGLRDSIWGSGWLPGQSTVQTHICRECGAEFDTDEAEKWRGNLCGSCARVDAQEREILEEWEKEQQND